MSRKVYSTTAPSAALMHKFFNDYLTYGVGTIKSYVGEPFSGAIF